MKKGIKTMFAILTVAGVTATLTACSMPSNNKTDNAPKTIYEQLSEDIQTIENYKSATELSFVEKLNNQFKQEIVESVTLNDIYKVDDEDYDNLVLFDAKIKFKNQSKIYDTTLVLPNIRLSKDITSSWSTLVPMIENDTNVLNFLKDRNDENNKKEITEKYTYENFVEINNFIKSLKLIDVNVHFLDFNNTNLDYDEIKVLYNAYKDYSSLIEGIEKDLCYEFNHVLTSPVIDKFKLSSITFEPQEDGTVTVNWNGKIKYVKLEDYHDVSFGLNGNLNIENNIDINTDSNDITDYGFYYDIQRYYQNIGRGFSSANQFMFDGEKSNAFDIQFTNYEKFKAQYLAEHPELLENSDELTK